MTGFTERTEMTTVCLVEHVESVRQVLANRMEEEGFRVVCALGTCEDAKREFALRRPELGIIDDRLPDGRGVDLCRDLHRRVPGVAFLLHAAVLSREERWEAEESGVSAVILKSLDLSVLFRTMWAIAGRRVPERRR